MFRRVVAVRNTFKNKNILVLIAANFPGDRLRNRRLALRPSRGFQKWRDFRTKH